MFATGIPSGFFDGEAISPEGDFWFGSADPFVGSASFSLNVDLGRPDASAPSPSVTLTFILESPGRNVCFGLPMGELAAGKAGVSGGALRGATTDASEVAALRPSLRVAVEPSYDIPEGTGAFFNRADKVANRALAGPPGEGWRLSQQRVLFQVGTKPLEGAERRLSSWWSDFQHPLLKPREV